MTRSPTRGARSGAAARALTDQPSAAGPRGFPVKAFAVDDRSTQLTWRDLRPGHLRVQVPDIGLDRIFEVTGEPGAALIDGLPAGVSTTLQITLPEATTPEGMEIRTLPRLPGAELTRLATIGDLHLGARAFGHRDTIVETPEPEVLHPVRCTRAAFAEIDEWGAQHLLVKGDITNHGLVDEWRTYASLAAEAPCPVHALPGNHDRGRRAGRANLSPEQAAPAFGLSLALPMTVLDLPGVRVVMADSTLAGRNLGSVTSIADDLVDAVAEADRDCSVLVALHHQLQPRAVPEGWPFGVPRAESTALVDRLAVAHPRVIVTGGHTHRHRRWERRGVVITQVGSVKDYPGVWAGYVVSEGGLRQVVRRVSAPDCLRWTDLTRRAAFGAWRFVGPGLLRDRCLALRTA